MKVRPTHQTLPHFRVLDIKMKAKNQRRTSNLDLIGTVDLESDCDGSTTHLAAGSDDSGDLSQRGPGLLPSM